MPEKAKPKIDLNRREMPKQEPEIRRQNFSGSGPGVYRRTGYGRSQALPAV